MKQYHLHKIKHYADDMFHCGDYGSVYLKNDLSEVYIVLGDGDETDLDEFEQYVKNLGLNFFVECESEPQSITEYTLISCGIEFYEDEDEEDCEPEYIFPKLLSLDQYATYKSLFNKLDN